MPPLAATPVAEPALGALQARWLAETVRRHEERAGPLDDRAALAAPGGGQAPHLPHGSGPDAHLETCILARADRLGREHGWRDAILRSARYGRVLLALAAVFAFVAGCAAAAGVLGDGARAVNVVWALGGLLGVNLLSLLLWACSLPFSGGRPAAGVGGLSGRIGAALLGLVDRSPAAAALPGAFFGLLGPARLRWGVGAVNHALWALALAGAAAAALLLFATRRYGFVWETTILPAEVFIALGDALGRLPAALGLPVPDAATVAASGAGGGVLDEAGRRAWAGWLLGCLLVYGLVPRLLLALLCAALWRRALAVLRLDLARPGYAVLRERLLPDSCRLGVSDPELAAAAAPPAAARLRGADGGRIALALELGDDLPWPPAFLAGLPGVADSRLDSREQRHAWLARLRAEAPGRLLVAVDARQTPDRGSLRLIAELAAQAGAVRVWALAPAGSDGRAALWREGLARFGVAPGGDAGTALLVDAEAARAWLEAA